MRAFINVAQLQGGFILIPVPAAPVQFEENIRVSPFRAPVADKIQAMRFGVLGPLQVFGPSGAVTLGGRGQRILLATLLCDCNRAISSERLIDAVWEGAPPRTAAKNLQVYVYQLRRALGDAERITRYPHGYGLVVHDGESDASIFLDLVQRARQAVATGEIHKGRSIYVDALNMWRGPAFAELSSAGALRETIARLDDSRLQALEGRIETDLLLGEHDNVAAELAALVREHPLRERLLGQLMIALFRCGRQSEALQAYQDGYRNLRDELGVEPTPALQSVQLSILRGIDPSPAPKPLAAAVVAGPAQLPALPRGFVGRREALAQLDSLADAGPGVVAIAGMGGIGKTALAVAWGHHASHRFPDGQLYVNLSGHSGAQPLEPSLALALMLRSLDVWALDIPADLDGAAALLRTTVAGKRLLIVLDDAASVAQVRPLLPGGRHCFTVVTSRNRLKGLVAREGATRLDLDVLAPAEAHAALAALLGADRLAAEPAAVATLADECGRLPLALRICASHLADRPHLGVPDLVDELAQERLRTLQTDDDPLTSIATVFSHSYTALSPAEQEMFCLMAHSPAVDVTVPAAAVLAGVDEPAARATLDRLVSSSMADRSRSDRYRLHDLLREFALAISDRPETSVEEAVSRLTTWYLRVSHLAGSRLSPAAVRLPLPVDVPVSGIEFAQWDEANSWLEAERENLVALIAWAAGTVHSQLCWLIVDAMRGFYNIRGLINEYLWLAGLARRSAESAGDQAGIAAAHLALAAATGNLGDLDAMRRHARSAASAAEAAGWPHGSAAAQTAAYQASFWLAQFDEALVHLERSFAIALALGERSGQCHLHNEFTHLYVHMGRYADAEHHYQQVLALNDELDVPLYSAHAQYNRGLLMRRLGRHAEAIDLVQRARAILRTVGLQFESTCAGVIAEIHLDQNQLDEAEPLLALAQEHVTDAYFRPVEHATARRRARLHRLRGKPAAAQAILTELLAEPTLSPMDRILVLEELAAIR